MDMKQGTHRGADVEEAEASEQKRSSGRSQSHSSNSTLDKLENEWSLEKIMKVAAAGIVIASIFMNKKQYKKLEEFGTSMASVLGVESLQEWTPPDGIMKKLGVRSQKEIEAEIRRLAS